MRGGGTPQRNHDHIQTTNKLLTRRRMRSDTQHSPLIKSTRISHDITVLENQPRFKLLPEKKQTEAGRYSWKNLAACWANKTIVFVTDERNDCNIIQCNTVVRCCCSTQSEDGRNPFSLFIRSLAEMIIDQHFVLEKPRMKQLNADSSRTFSCTFLGNAPTSWYILVT